MRDLLQEKDRTREAVSQIVSWCLVIALHQTEGIGKKRQDDVAAKALVIQEAAAKRLARQSREEVIAWLRSKLDRLDLPDFAQVKSREIVQEYFRIFEKVRNLLLDSIANFMIFFMRI